jgi:hypothetical protein
MWVVSAYWIHNPSSFHRNVFFSFWFLFLGPHPIRIHAPFFAHGHAVTHGFIRQIAINGVSGAIVHIFAHVILPTRWKRRREFENEWRKYGIALLHLTAGKKGKRKARAPVVFLDFFVSRGFKNVGSLVVFFVVAFAFWVGRHGELDFDVSIICVIIIILKNRKKTLALCFFPSLMRSKISFSKQKHTSKVRARLKSSHSIVVIIIVLFILLLWYGTFYFQIKKMIGYDDTNDRRVGLPRGPEVFGATEIDDERDQLKNKILEFEKRIDKNNKEHVDMLEKMRLETRELERLRGVWSERGLPGVSRDWNVQEAKTKTEPPHMRLEYREYIDYKEVERKRESSGPDRHLVTKMTKREGVDDVLARALPSTVSKSHGDSSSSPSSALKSKSKK